MVDFRDVVLDILGDFGYQRPTWKDVAQTTHPIEYSGMGGMLA